MANLLERGVNWAAGKLAAQASTVVVYCEGDQQVTLPATLGSQLLKLHDGRGNVKMQRTARDFIVSAALMTFDGTNLIIPKVGAMFRLPLLLPDGSAINWEAIQTQWQDIRWNWDGSTPREEFRVMAPGKGEAHWRYSDPFRSIMRIHSEFAGLI